MKSTLFKALSFFLVTAAMAVSIFFWSVPLKLISGVFLLLVVFIILYEDRGLPEFVKALTVLWPVLIWNCAIAIGAFFEDKWWIIGVFILVALILIAAFTKKDEYYTIFFIDSMLYGFVFFVLNIYSHSLVTLISLPFALFVLSFIISGLLDSDENDMAGLIATPLIANFIFFLWFFIANPNDYSITHTKDQQILEKKITQILQVKEDTIKRDITYFFDSLKTSNVISENIEPEFSLNSVMENERRVLKAEYSYYSFSEQGFTGVVSDYDPGKYHINESKAAYQMLKIIDRGLKQYLQTYLVKGEKVQIALYGYSDGLQYKRDRPAIYDGFEGEFPRPASSKEDAILDFVVNDTLLKGGIQLKKGDTITNETLAFLRAYCMKSEYLVNIVQLRDIEAKTQYTYNGYTKPPSETGDPKERKVKIEIRITNPDPLTLPAIAPANERKSCGIFWEILSLLLPIIFSTYAFFHYKRYHEKRDKNESYKKDKRRFLILTILIAVVLLFLWWWCPDSFWLGLLR